MPGRFRQRVPAGQQGLQHQVYGCAKRCRARDALDDYACFATPRASCGRISNPEDLAPFIDVTTTTGNADCPRRGDVAIDRLAFTINVGAIHVQVPFAWGSSGT